MIDRIGTIRGVELRHLRHELVDEDLDVGAQILDLRDQVVVAEQRRDRDAETGDGRDQRRRDTGRDRVDVDIARLRSPRR
ncbi:hypothetical protein AC629_18675 [Bradyrhizobium sp. NAS80.1]|nr:hypothetical protein AC629_18675 [Bradyrhizobium sp. NAS80.1]